MLVNNANHLRPVILSPAVTAVKTLIELIEGNVDDVPTVLVVQSQCLPMNLKFKVRARPTSSQEHLKQLRCGGVDSYIFG